MYWSTEAVTLCQLVIYLLPTPFFKQLFRLLSVCLFVSLSLSLFSSTFSFSLFSSTFSFSLLLSNYPFSLPSFPSPPSFSLTPYLSYSNCLKATMFSCYVTYLQFSQGFCDYLPVILFYLPNNLYIRFTSFLPAQPPVYQSISTYHTQYYLSG